MIVVPAATLAPLIPWPAASTVPETIAVTVIVVPAMEPVAEFAAIEPVTTFGAIEPVTLVGVSNAV